MKPDFDASGWKTGPGGFGTAKTPGTTIGTVWDSKDIWVRTEFDYDPTKGKLVLNLHYDEDPIIYINGVKAAQPEGFTVDYILSDISPEAQLSLKAGKNTIAIYCVREFINELGTGGLLGAPVVIYRERD